MFTGVKTICVIDTALIMKDFKPKWQLCHFFYIKGAPVSGSNCPCLFHTDKH